MYLAVKDVYPIPDFRLILTFSNGEKRLFDMNPYLNLPVFQELKNVADFNSVRVNFDTISWMNGADFDPEVLYNESVLTEIDFACDPESNYGINNDT
jgi:hypothetical protein